MADQIGGGTVPKLFTQQMDRAANDPVPETVTGTVNDRDCHAEAVRVVTANSAHQQIRTVEACRQGKERNYGAHFSVSKEVV